MSERKLTEQKIEAFHQYLIREEKSTATVEKSLGMSVLLWFMLEKRADQGRV